MSDTDTTAPEDAAVAEALGIPLGEGQGQEPVEQEPEREQQTEIAFEDLPESWQKEIRKLRREAAAKRTASKSTAKQSDSEDAVQTAREEARQEARMEFGEKLAAARIEAALAGLVDDPADLVEELNLRKFVTEDGDVDTEAVTLLKTKYARLSGKRSPRVGHGKSSDPNATKGSPADQFAEAIKDLF